MRYPIVPIGSYRALNAAWFLTTSTYSPGPRSMSGKANWTPSANWMPARPIVSVAWIFQSSTYSNSLLSPYGTSGLPGVVSAGGGLYMISVIRSGTELPSRAPATNSTGLDQWL